MDIKDSDDMASCIRVRQLVDKYERAEYTTVGNGSYQNSKNIREAFQGSQVLYLASWEEGVGYLGAYLFGLAPFFRMKGIDVIAMPWMTRDFTARKQALREHTSIWDADYWAATLYVFVLPFITRLSPGFLKHLDKRGIVTNYWVLNCDDEVERVAR